MDIVEQVRESEEGIKCVLKMVLDVLSTHLLEELKLEVGYLMGCDVEGTLPRASLHGLACALIFRPAVWSMRRGDAAPGHEELAHVFRKIKGKSN